MGNRKKGGGSNKGTSSATENGKKNSDEWKFKLSNWVELPDIWDFVGSSFIISGVVATRTSDGKCDYDITISKLPNENPYAQLYPSIMDVVKKNKKARAKLNKNKGKRSNK